MFALVKRIVSFLISMLMIFSTEYKNRDMGDSCYGMNFPRITAAEKHKDLTRVMSFNIRCADVNGVAAEDRYDIVVKQIEEIKPDSFGVQEATPAWMRALSRKLPQYGWVGLARDNGRKIFGKGEYSAVFYLKSKYKVKDSGTFWLSETPDAPSYGPGAACRRVCTWAVLKEKSGKAEYVHVNSHYDHVSEEARVFAANAVTGFIDEKFSGMNVVFTADINTTEKGAAYATMTQNLVNAAETAGRSRNYGTFHACNPMSHSDYNIDFILCSKNIEVASYRTVTAGIDGRFVSDHFPIYADIKI